MRWSWHRTLLAFIGLGLVLRFVWLGDIEYKVDEEYMYRAVIMDEAFTWVGMPSSVGIRNPGLSVVVFGLLGSLFQVESPPELAAATVFLVCLTFALFLYLIYRAFPREEKEVWLWTLSAASVNWFAILISRKIWTIGVLPFFGVFLFWSWRFRKEFWGAFFWGLTGALIGQVHLSGVFFAFAIWLGTIVFRKGLHWKGWLLGSVLGSLSFIPWVMQLNSAGGKGVTLTSLLSLDFWLVLFKDMAGIGYHYSLGEVHTSEFLNYPFPNLGFALQAVLVASTFVVLGMGIFVFVKDRLWSKISDTGYFAIFSVVIYGVVLSLLNDKVHRHYTFVIFPFAWWIWAKAGSLHWDRQKWIRPLLFLTLFAQFWVSVNFLSFIHKNGGAPQGDYGVAYGRH